MIMELFVFILLIFILLIVKVLLPKKEKNILINWSDKYNSSCDYFSIDSRINQYIQSQRIVEKDCSIEKGIHGYGLWESYKDSYPTYSYYNLI